MKTPNTKRRFSKATMGFRHISSLGIDVSLSVMLMGLTFMQDVRQTTQVALKDSAEALSQLFASCAVMGLWSGTRRNLTSRWYRKCCGICFNIIAYRKGPNVSPVRTTYSFTPPGGSTGWQADLWKSKQLRGDRKREG